MSRGKQLLRLSGLIEASEERFVAYCNELPLGAVGTTPERAMGNLLECLATYLGVAEEQGSLAEILDSHGAVAVEAGTTVSGAFTLTMPSWSEEEPSLAAR